MKKLDLFILKSFIGPFFAILAITIFILVMQFLWLYIDELVGKGLELKVILEFLMWGSCQVLPLALPLATLLAHPGIPHVGKLPGAAAGPAAGDPPGVDDDLRRHG